jgi:large subunit ribosomal protein L3
MTQIFEESGVVVPVTVIEAGPCPSCRCAPRRSDGYRRCSSASARRRTSRATSAERATRKAGLETAPAVLREFRSPRDEEAPAVGDQVTVEGFESAPASR